MESIVGKIEDLAEQLCSSDEEIRRLAVIGLSACPVGEAKDYLLAALGDASWRVRKATVDALLAESFSVELVEELVVFLASDNAGLRNSTVEALERLGDRAMPVLLRHVTDDDHDVRKFVIDILGSIGNAEAVPFLVRALDDPEPNVYAAAAENLGKIGDVRAVPHLLQALGKNDVWMRYTILEALSMIGQPVPMAVITPMVGENLLKKAAFDCLGAIGEAEAVPLLLEGLKERVKNIREAAVVALMKVRERLPEQTAKVLVDENLAACNGAPFVEGLLISLDTSDRCLKETLIKVLGIIGDERGIEGLLQSFRDDRLRKQCLLAFKSMGEQAAAALIRIFPGADDDERSSIAYLCGELRFRGSVQILREGLRDSDPVLRRVSVKAAAKAGFSSLIKEIGPLLDDKEPEVREGAVEALSSLAAEDRDAVQKIAGELASAELPEKRCNAAVLFASLADADKLSLLIKDDDAKVRKTAVHSLAALKKESCVGLLVMALADESADVRIAAAGALGEIGGADLLEPLLLAMKDDDARVKCAALKSLGKLHYVGARRAIKDLLASATDGLVTISALKSLAEIDGEESLALVRNALAHPDEEVVKAAIEILSLKGDAWLEDYRESLLAHPHWDVRRSFIKVMVANQGGKALPYLKTVLVAEKDDLVRGQILEILDRYQ